MIEILIWFSELDNSSSPPLVQNENLTLIPDPKKSFSLLYHLEGIIHFYRFDLICYLIMHNNFIGHHQSQIVEPDTLEFLDMDTNDLVPQTEQKDDDEASPVISSESSHLNSSLSMHGNNSICYVQDVK